LDYKTKEFITYAAEKGDTKNTINFVEYLRQQRQQSQTFNNVEDIWLQAKRLIREFYFFCHSFAVVKALFELSINCQIFDFPKLHNYGVFS